MLLYFDSDKYTFLYTGNSNKADRDLKTAIFA